MKPDFNVDSYKTKFLAGHRAYHFWIKIAWPGWSNIATSGLQSGLSVGMENLTTAGRSALQGATTTGVDTLPFLFDNSITKNSGFYVKSSSLPDSNISELKTNWMGAEYKLGGKVTFGDWSVTFYIDHQGDILRMFKKWQDVIINPATNVASKPVTYMVDQEAHLLGLDGETICVYKFYGAWPKTLGNVSLDYMTNDISTMDVTFSYQYYMLFEKEQGALKEFLRKGAYSGIQGTLQTGL